MVQPADSRAPPYRGRFAPSPTGDLHLGSLAAALGSWLLARRRQGTWLVRIEDLDPPREQAGAAARQLETLAAFGMESDEAVLWQSRRAERYRQVLKILIDQGDVFACHCSRRQLQSSGGIHRRCLADRGRGTPAYRLRVPAADIRFRDAIQGDFGQNLLEEVGDVVLKRADGYWAYQLAVVVDDADQGITDVVRGADLLDSTPRQIYLQRRLGFVTPNYAHLPLVLGPDGQKLSKSLRSCPVDPADPLPALRLAWHCLGQNPAGLPERGSVPTLMQTAQREFDPAAIPRHPTLLPS